MNIEDFSRLLREVMTYAPAIEAGEIVTLVDQHEAGFDLVQERILDLVRKRAGIVPVAKGDSPPQRLNSLRLGTTYPGVRQAALRKLVLDNEDQIADLAGRLLSVRLRRDLALAELEMEAARSQEVREARAERRRDQLYAEVGPSPTTSTRRTVSPATIGRLPARSNSPPSLPCCGRRRQGRERLRTSSRADPPTKEGAIARSLARRTETVTDTIDEDETMIMDNPGPAFFEADPANEYSLTFSLLSPLHAAGRKTLMWMRCFEEDKLRGAIVFLGERQHLWPEWRAIAEREGGNHLSAIIAQLALADARKRYGAGNYMFELCTGAKIENVGEAGIRLAMTLATRTLPIIEHAFADAATRTAFVEGQLFGDRFEGAVELAEHALLRGRGALASRLDSIAAARAATHSRSVH